MYVPFYVLLLLISLSAGAMESVDCKVSLAKVSLSQQSQNSLAYLNQLIEMRVFTEETLDKLKNIKSFQLRDLRFNPGVSVAMEMGIKKTLSKVLNAQEVKDEAEELSRVLNEMITSTYEKEKSIENVKEITKPLPKLELLFSGPEYWSQKQITQYQGKNMLMLKNQNTERAENKEYFDLEETKIKSRKDGQLPSFIGYKNIRTEIEGVETHFVYEAEERKNVLYVGGHEKTHIKATRYDLTFALSLYRGPTGQYFISTDATISDIFKYEKGELTRSKPLEVLHGYYSLAASESHLYFIGNKVSRSSDTKLQIYDIKDDNKKIEIPVDFHLVSTLENARLHVSEVTLNGVAHAILNTNRGLKLLNLKTWEIANLGKEGFDLSVIHSQKLSDNKVLFITSNRGSVSKQVDIYDFDDGIKPMSSYSVDIGWHINSQPIFKKNEKYYMAYYTSNHVVVVADAISGDFITKLNVSSPTKNDPLLLTTTNNQGNPFIVLIDTIRGKKLEIYKVKDL